jgi:tetratricopeptide (TPR) repeat protein
MTDQAQWDRVEAALDAILALPESQWSDASARIAGHDAALLAEIRSLLEHTGGSDPVLDQPLAIPDEQSRSDIGLPAGTRVGAYRIIELIGRGGMGEVYRAARADGQYEQEVALKLIRGELSGNPERFQAERQMLAQLQHPGIARLLDGGVFGALPYMAIELVDGVPITDWCRANRSDLATRLRLFIGVCDAVTHAHSNLIVHRDIKPGNVLVTPRGDVKLLDFGVAKLLTAGPQDATRNAPLTPAYSAPEQLTGGAITTATDVYALGILLFELLCGELPWKSDGLSFGVAVRKMLSETVPTLSRRARYSREAMVPWNSLRGDLDAILAKALRKEPRHRYATVNGLREDVWRFLRHEPVEAREGARLYVAGRFVRRQPLLVALLLAIVAGSAGVALQSRVALRQAQRAEREGEKAQAVKDFLLDIFKQSSVQNPGGVEAKNATAQQLLDVGATRIKVQLRDQPEVREELMDTLAQLNNDLGLTDRAESLAADNLAELQSRTHGQPTVALARLHARLATSLIDRYETAAARQHLEAALVALRAVGAMDTVDAAAAYFQLGRAAYNGTTQDKVAGIADLRQALQILQHRDPTNPLQGDVLDYLARYAKLDEDNAAAERWLNDLLAFQTAQGVERNAFAIGDAYFNLGDFQSLTQRYDEAERNLRQAVPILIRAVGPTHPTAADARARLGELLFYMGRWTDAAPILYEAMQAQMSTPQGIEDATETRKTLGQLEFARGRWPQAEQLLRQNLRQMQDLPDKELRYGISAGSLSAVLTAEGRLAEARTLYEKSLDVYARYSGEKSHAYARMLGHGGQLAIAEDNPKVAATLFERVLDGWPPARGELPGDYAAAVLGMAAVQLESGETEEARRSAEPLLTKILGLPQPTQYVALEAQTRRLLGEALRQSGMLTDAEVHLRRAVELRQSLDDPDSPWLAQARINLAECLIARHQTRDARALLDMAGVAQSHQPLLRESYRRELAGARAMLRSAT